MAAEGELPEEVMMSILCWLPVKSLIRFTSISKRWRFIILSDPQFAASQVNAARHRKTLDRRLIFSASTQLESLDLADTASFGHPSSVRQTLPVERVGGDVRLLGSCNGLVFVAFGVSCFYIWNPATRFLIQLPEPGFSDGQGQELMHHGVGYLSATDDYKIFAASYGLYQDGNEEDENEENWVETEEMKMFSSRADVWKTVQGLDHFTISTDQGILLNEALHWTTSWGVIVVFDFGHEDFRKMRLPVADVSEYKYGVDFQNAGVCEGCLCVCSQLSDRTVDFWIMREYGVDESWTKLFKFSDDSPERFGGFLVTESCTIASKWDRLHQLVLVKIDHKQEEEIGTYVIQNCWHKGNLHMISYEESLLWINN